MAFVLIQLHDDLYLQLKSMSVFVGYNAFSFFYYACAGEKTLLSLALKAILTEPDMFGESQLPYPSA